MFSRFSTRNPQAVAADIAIRATPTCSSVRRPPATSGEQNYTYKDGFRFQQSSDNYAENLVKDYNDYMAQGNNETVLPYHHAITALHHANTARQMARFSADIHIVRRLAATPNTTTNTSLHDHDHDHDHDHLPPFLASNKIQHLQQQQAIVHIQRPLSDSTLTIARGVVMTQVTPISALRPHQRLRIAAGSLASLLAIRLCCERTTIQAIVNQHANNYRDSHYLHNVHNDAIHRILRRASGSRARINQIAAPYTECATILQGNIPAEQHAVIKQYMAARFQPPPPITPESIFGPQSFHTAEFFANKCLELLGNPAASATDATTDPAASAARWAKLRADVQRVRRGELTAYQVIADPGPENDYWVYAVKNTFHHAIQNYLGANTEWLTRHDRHTRHTEGRKHINTEKGESIYWPRSKEIRTNASRVVQTTLMIRSMYRFIIRASCVLSPEFMGVFGYNLRFVKVLISRAKHIATNDGDEASALMFAHFMPCLMTPEAHLDIFVGGNVFQHPELYVKRSDNVLGEIKKESQDVIPSRHTGTINRATLMDPVPIRSRV